MPYRVSGKNVEHFKNGEWSVKQHCESHKAAVDAMQLLRGIEHNPTFAAKVKGNKKGK